jgi:sarcosine oxidase
MRWNGTVVLGAGIAGSSTAYHLSQRGEPVLLLDQFQPGHNRGSSHGATRIIRHSYADLAYARLMPSAYRMWAEFEAEAAVHLFTRTGGLSFCTPGVPYVAQVVHNLEAVGVPHRRMTGAECARCLPPFAPPVDWDVVFEPDAGMIHADRAVAQLQHQARKLGATLQPATRVARIDLEGSRPVLQLNHGETIETDRLVVAAGAWLPCLLPRWFDRLEPTRQRVLYFAAEYQESFAIGNFPIFIFMGPEPSLAFYGMPDTQGRGVKVARHHGPRCDPDQADDSIDGLDVDTVRGFLRTLLPALAEAPLSATETCLYTMAPGEQFLVDFTPGRTDAVVASPCSGHGFKFGILVGSVVADLLLQGSTPHAVDHWRWLSPPRG